MLTIKELTDNQYVIHDESGKEYKIIDTTLQMQVDSALWFDGWVPAVSYKIKTDVYDYRAQIFVQPMHEFMKKFSIKKEETKE